MPLFGARSVQGNGSENGTPSDVTLRVAVARGTGDALAEIYRRHGGQVHGLALRLCGDSRAEDVVQEVFLELWQEPERFVGGGSSLRSSLVLQTYGRSVDRLRSDRARDERQTSPGCSGRPKER